jgi:hypothetical protein
MNYADQLAALRAADPELGARVAPLRNLEAILKWAPGAGIPFAGIDLVQQDEYSYDLYLPLPDPKGEPPAGSPSHPLLVSRWLVFGVS